MYFQLTTKCNMTCGHCCFSATHRGKDMSDEVFKAALRLAQDLDDYELTLGGGEPTLHPKFWEFLGLTLKASALMYSDLKPLVITNGSVTDTSLALARLNKAGAIYAELSQDEWHDPIDPKVIREFMQNAGMRTVRHIKSVGRGKGVAGSSYGCCCETMLVDPEGSIWSCGCKRVRWGTVFAPEIPEDRYDDNGDHECGQDRIKRLRKVA